MFDNCVRRAKQLRLLDTRRSFIARARSYVLPPHTYDAQSSFVAIIFLCIKNVCLSDNKNKWEAHGHPTNLIYPTLWWSGLKRRMQSDPPSGGMWRTWHSGCDQQASWRKFVTASSTVWWSDRLKSSISRGKSKTWQKQDINMAETQQKHDRNMTETWQMWLYQTVIA